MAFQPKLNKSTPHIGKINYTLKRTESSCAKAKGPIDDAHIHTCYEIYVNVSGNVSFLHGNKVFEIKPYDVIFSRPGELHHCIYRPELPHDHYCLWFNDDGNYFENESLCNFSGHLRLNESEKKRLARLLEKLDEETNTETEEIICLLSVFSLISGKENAKETEITRSESRINKILEYIKNTYSDYQRNLYRISLTGTVSSDFVPNTVQMKTILTEHLPYIRISDNTDTDFSDIGKIAAESSLRGVFVQKLLEMSDSADQKDSDLYRQAIKLGLRAFEKGVSLNDN